MQLVQLRHEEDRYYAIFTEGLHARRILSGRVMIDGEGTRVKFDGVDTDLDFIQSLELTVQAIREFHRARTAVKPGFSPPPRRVPLWFVPLTLIPASIEHKQSSQYDVMLVDQNHNEHRIFSQVLRLSRDDYRFFGVDISGDRNVCANLHSRHIESMTVAFHRACFPNDSP